MKHNDIIEAKTTVNRLLIIVFVLIMIGSMIFG